MTETRQGMAILQFPKYHALRVPWNLTELTGSQSNSSAQVTFCVSGIADGHPLNVRSLVSVILGY
jgi:hypothetical protein